MQRVTDMNNVNNPAYKRVVLHFEARSEAMLEAMNKPAWLCVFRDYNCDGGCDLHAQHWEQKEREAGL